MKDPQKLSALKSVYKKKMCKKGHMGRCAAARRARVAAPPLNPALPNARVSTPAAPPLNPVLPEKWDRGRE